MSLIESNMAFIKESVVFRSLFITLLFIHPLKIVGAFLNFNFLFLLLLPVTLYLYLIRSRSLWIQNHIYVFAIQLLLCLLSYASANELPKLNVPFGLMLYSPHFFLMTLNTYRTENKDFFINSSLIYVCLLMSILIYSGCIYASAHPTALLNFSDLFQISNFARTNTTFRYALFEAMNIGKNIFNLKENVWMGNAITIFPLIFCSAILTSFEKIKKKEYLILAISFLLIIAKNSRAEILYLAAISGIYLFRNRIPSHSWVYALPFFVTFPFLQLFYEKNFLNGRQILNQLFSENITFFGNGISFTRNHVHQLVHGQHASVHNIHFETILNFGLLVYLVSITALILGLKRLNTKREDIKLFFQILIFFLLSTSYELFDIYFWFLAGVIIASNRSAMAGAAVNPGDSIPSNS
jgi:hypothetical protein